MAQTMSCLIAQPKTSQLRATFWATSSLDARFCLPICPKHPRSQDGMMVYHKILNLTNTQTHCQLVQLDSHCPQRTEQNICLLLCSITFVIPFHLIMPENKSIQSIRVTTNQQVFLCHCCFSCKIMSTNEYWWSVNNYNLLSIAIRSREKKAAAGVGKRQLQIYILPHNSIQAVVISQQPSHHLLLIFWVHFRVYSFTVICSSRIGSDPSQLLWILNAILSIAY